MYEVLSGVVGVPEANRQTKEREMNKKFVREAVEISTFLHGLHGSVTAEGLSDFCKKNPEAKTTLKLINLVYANDPKGSMSSFVTLSETLGVRDCTDESKFAETWIEPEDMKAFCDSMNAVAGTDTYKIVLAKKAETVVE
jgi:hypothetical protein